MQGEERLPREDRGERVDMGEVWLGVVGGVCSHQAKEMSRENREKETIIKSTKMYYIRVWRRLCTELEALCDLLPLASPSSVFRTFLPSQSAATNSSLTDLLPRAQLVTTGTV